MHQSNESIRQYRSKLAAAQTYSIGKVVDSSDKPGNRIEASANDNKGSSRLIRHGLKLGSRKIVIQAKAVCGGVLWRASALRFPFWRPC